MSKIREFFVKQKKLFRVHLISLLALITGCLLCRYVFFWLHGLGEWPFDLLGFGMITWLLSLAFGKQYVPWVIPSSYFLWFWIGVILNKETVDAHGTRGDTMPFIWLWGFLGCILVSFLVESIIKWWKLLRLWKEHR